MLNAILSSFYSPPSALPTPAPFGRPISDTHLLADPPASTVCLADRPISQGLVRTKKTTARFRPFMNVTTKLSLPESSSERDDALSPLPTAGSGNPNKALIPKPTGYAGRSGSGGYNLRDQFIGHFNDAEWLNLRREVHGIIEKYLDEAAALQDQNEDRVEIVVSEALRKYRLFEDYEDRWPLRDILQARLHYTSGQARLKGDRAVIKDVFSAVKDEKLSRGRKSKKSGK